MTNDELRVLPDPQSAVLSRGSSICRLVALILLMAHCGYGWAAETVTIPDVKLDAAIRAALARKRIEKTDPNVALTDEDLATIFFLEVRDMQITNLAGLEYCRNLAELRLTGNRISDMTPLAKCLELQSLDLDKNRIADAAPLAGLVKLQYLLLADNQIESLAPLVELKALTTLAVGGNRLTSLAPVAQLTKLTSLYAERNQIVEISALEHCLALQSLDLKQNRVANLAPLQSLKNLRWTFLEENRLTDLTPLLVMTREDVAGAKRFAPYWRVALAGNPLSDQGQKDAQELRRLGVRLIER